MSTNELSMPVAVLLLPGPNKDLLTAAKAVRDHVDGNPNFPAPEPAVDVISADIAAFDQAETKVASGAKGAAKLRDALKLRVKEDLARLRNYVQSVARQQPSPAEAAAVIESAFMSVKKPHRGGKPALQARNTATSGRVVVMARAVAPVATYFWQYRANEETWIDAPVTMRASITISGLTRAAIYVFRFRAITRSAETDWSDAVTLIVH